MSDETRAGGKIDELIDGKPGAPAALAVVGPAPEKAGPNKPAAAVAPAAAKPAARFPSEAAVEAARSGKKPRPAESMTLAEIESELAEIGDPVAWMRSSASGLNAGVEKELERRREFDAALNQKRVEQQKIDRAANALLDRARALNKHRTEIERSLARAQGEKKAAAETAAIAKAKEARSGSAKAGAAA